MSENILFDNSNCAAIFDFDGTLLDSLNVWDDIDNESFAKRGVAVPENFANSTATFTPRQVADYVIEHFGFTDSPEDLMKEWQDMAADAYANRLELRKGAKDYVIYLRKSRAKLVLLTSLSKTLCELSLKHTGLREYFDFIIFGEDLEKTGKNRAQTYIDLANKIGVLPNNCTVFEDSDVALSSARKAGMKICKIFDCVQAKSLKNNAFDGCCTGFSDFSLAPKNLKE